MSAGTEVREADRTDEPVGGRTNSRARPGDWVRDLAMGARFATSGGRQGWLRTLLTAVGVALGVAVLLLAASVPQISSSRDARGDARTGGLLAATEDMEPSPYSVLTKDANTHFLGDDVFGVLLKPDGGSPAEPPGVREIPAPGEMVVSPALKALLDTPEGKPLKDRLDGRVVGTIGEKGLLGPAELAFYKGADDLSVKTEAQRLSRFGSPVEDQPLDPVLLLLVVVACAVLIMPVAIFIATAVRFGGEQRDTRLAALRLVGADAAMARRMAAGESLVGALLGLVLGGWFFLLGRVFIGRVEMFGMSVFPADVTPGLGLGLLIAVGVPLTAVAVTIFALRGVAIEPLGLVRRTEQRPRRLWWRLLPPAAGAALLLPLAGSVAGETPSVNEAQITGAVVLLLGGIALLLPWLVERIVARLRGGPVSWQLATRRLQLSSGNASRAVSGITIAVAGSIALQMLFAAAETSTGDESNLSRDKAQVSVFGGYTTLAGAESLTAKLKRTEGVEEAQGYLQAWVLPKGGSDDEGVTVTVASCATLQQVAHIDKCRNGDSFIARPEKDEPAAPERGSELYLGGEPGADDGGDTAREHPWRVPETARTVTGVEAPEGGRLDGVLATPAAIPSAQLHDRMYQGWAVTDRTDEALENLRTVLFHVDPSYSLFESHGGEAAEEVATVRRAVQAAAVAVLLLIGASMIVSTLEQLRERKRQLSVLVAFGTKRSTLGVSVLWQTAVPVALGIGLAMVFGLGLGWGLLRLLDAPTTEWLVFLPVTAAGTAVIALVTLVSLPFLWRMMRPDGLRTE